MDTFHTQPPPGPGQGLPSRGASHSQVDRRKSEEEEVHVTTRENDEGVNTKRADGRWIGRLSLPNGKRKAVYRRTRAETSMRMKRA